MFVRRPLLPSREEWPPPFLWLRAEGEGRIKEREIDINFPLFLLEVASGFEPE